MVTPSCLAGQFHREGRSGWWKGKIVVNERGTPVRPKTPQPSRSLLLLVGLGLSLEELVTSMVTIYVRIAPNCLA